jgi:hypothetical protein|tara:strand:+ start:737 stop:2164 length:1428 start_codon:yes stop_codon:yes gene_type:complete
MKIFFVIKSALWFSYFESVIKTLLDRGHTVKLYFYLKHSRKYPRYALDNFLKKNRGLEVHFIEDRDELWRRPLKFLRQLVHYSFILSQSHQDEYHIDLYLNRLTKNRFLILLFSLSVFKTIVKQKLARKLFLFFNSSIFSLNKNAVLSIQNFQPDIVLATPVNFTQPDELDYLEAAKASAIKTVIPILSWDNLAFKGSLQFVPDWLFVWNEHQMNEAIEYHNVPKEKVVIIGSTVFDKWFHLEDYLLTREELFNRFNFDPAKNYAVYLGNAPHVGAENEKLNNQSWLPLKISEAMLNSSDSRINELNLIVRPHGGNQDDFKNIKGDNITLWLRDEVLPESEDSFKMYASALYYATCTIGLNTTAMVDSVLTGTPTITMIIDEYKNSSTLSATYFMKILEYDIYNIANDIDSCIRLIKSFMEGINPKETNRERFLESFARPRGLTTDVGEVFTREIERIYSTFDEESKKTSVCYPH